ncbi:MAG: SGNH hydrolase domain-containing protein [Solirubrobacteraceae bacterium]
MRVRLLTFVAAVLAAATFLPVASATSPEKLRCFGGPSRDTVHPCRNPALDTKVFPKPDDALLYPNAPCDPIAGSEPYQCDFGLPLEKAKGTIALVGDSHATHWRSALETVTDTYGWHGVSMTRSGCTFSAAEPVLPGKLKQECLDWRQQVYGWFTAHPEVRTVFMSQHPGDVVVPPGSTEWRTKVQGFRDAWKLLPKTVRHIVIIRDTPYVSSQTPDCVNAAMRAKENAGLVCALPRKRALKRDHAAEAAVLYKVPGVRLVDMTSFLCSDTSCFPVVGGALTHKDEGHITLVFGQTLGPYLLRKIRALGIKV